MKILVTGAAGFVGSWLAPELQKSHDVVLVDREDGDLAVPDRIDQLIDYHQPDTVVHLAAKYGRLLGEVDPAYTVEQNATVTTRVARACGRAGVKLVYVSSSEIYGDHGDHLITEDDTYLQLPHNVYGLSKRWGEEVCRLYAPSLVIARLNMPYGPGQESGFGRCALINMVENARNGVPLVVHRGAKRSWCFVEDSMRGLCLVIEQGGGVFNVGRDDDERSMVAVAGLACDLAGADHGLIEVVDPPSMQTVVKRISMARLRGLGWQPSVSLEDGMAATFAGVEAYGRLSV